MRESGESPLISSRVGEQKIHIRHEAMKLDNKGVFNLLVKESGADGQPDIKARGSGESSPLFKIAEPNVKNKANCTEIDSGQVGRNAQTKCRAQTAQVHKKVRLI